MTKFMITLMAIGLVFALFAVSGVLAQEEVDIEAEEIVTGKGEVIDIFKVYTEKWAGDNHYCPSGWMGDYGDIKLDDNCKDNPHSGKTCIKISYSAKGSQGAGWMGIFWQNPPNNWGDQMGGYDLTGHKKFTFWARGENGGEEIAEFKAGGISGMYSDSDSASIGPVTLTKEWKQYEINLTGLDLSYISGGFCFAARSLDNPNGFTFYLDDIKYEK